jgi:HAMP domain-containing protein
LEQEIREAGARIEEVMAEAKPICAKKRESQAMADECARLRLYLEDAMRALKELEAQRRAAAKACKS